MPSKKSIFFMVLAIFIGGCACQSKPQDNPSLSQLGTQFKQLRAIKGHFYGGNWNAKVDAFEGEKHRILKQLEAISQEGKLSAASLKKHFAVPDEEQVCESCDSPDYYIYYWRGKHDYLILYLEQQHVVSSQWQLSQE